MTSNEGQPAGPENQEQYEATVLDFLDKEMAAVQPSKKKDEQLDELDALVSDLLKQVITEADQPKDGNTLLLDEEDELFAGVEQFSKDAAAIASMSTPGQQAQPEITPVHKKNASIEQEKPQTQTAKPAPALFSKASAPSKSKLPVMVGYGGRGCGCGADHWSGHLFLIRVLKQSPGRRVQAGGNSGGNSGGQ
jgi:hypothetical protein